MDLHHYLVFKEKKSNKFYEISVSGTELTIRYGRVGTNGTSKTDTFDSAEEAKNAGKERYEEKIGKGYKEASAESKDDADEDESDEPKAKKARKQASSQSRPKPCNQEFRADRASIFLYKGDEDDEEGNITKKDLAKIKPWLRKGDLLENVSQSGYRSEGVKIYDGKKVIDLGYEIDDYGHPGEEFVVYREFNPLYWNYDSLNCYNILVPEKEEPQSMWHSENMPSVYIDREAVAQAVNCTIEMDGVAYSFPEKLHEWALNHQEEDEDDGETPYVNDVEMDGAAFQFV